MAGVLTCWAVEFFGTSVKAILPALGTHEAMAPAELDHMYPGIDHNLFIQHDWRHNVISLGTVPSEVIQRVSEGHLDYSWEAQVNSLLVDKSFDLVLSLGQVVPHEVVGMANYSKNIFIGTGGSSGINKSHFLSAVYGIEKTLGKTDTPVREILDYAQDNFTRESPLEYALTVVGHDAEGKMQPKGLFVGNDRTCFEHACALSRKVNIQMLDVPPSKVVVYLDPDEYHSAWLGNKSIYRTRMAIADGGELIVLAPGVARFGEDPEIDRLIRIYGYRGMKKTLAAVKRQQELKENLSAAAHLIHGSSEGRFTIRYCPGHLPGEDIESVGYANGDLNEMLGLYDPNILQDGWNTDRYGERFYYVSNPASGLWATADRFSQ
jgi:nickel-dependent lactate racemase